MNHGLVSARLLSLLACLVAFGIAQTTCRADDLRLRSQLIWGTDQDKPADSKLKEVNPKLAAAFKSIVKWKNYFLVDEQVVTAYTGKEKPYTLSPKCHIVVQHFGQGMVEVKFFGEGKLRATNKKVFPVGEPLVLAGNDKDENAWFVVLEREAKPEKVAEKKDKPSETPERPAEKPAEKPVEKAEKK